MKQDKRTLTITIVLGTIYILLAVIAGIYYRSKLFTPYEPMDCNGIEETFMKDPEDCSNYIICTDGQKQTLSCPEGLYFNPDKLFCDIPENVVCENTENKDLEAVTIANTEDDKNDLVEGSDVNRLSD